VSFLREREILGLKVGAWIDFYNPKQHSSNKVNGLLQRTGLRISLAPRFDCVLLWRARQRTQGWINGSEAMSPSDFLFMCENLRMCYYFQE
jgi:hypothetical protein